MNISVAAELMMPDLGLSKTSDGASVHQLSGGIRDVPSSRREIGGCVWPENRFDLAAVIWARPPCGSSLLCGARFLGDGGPSLAGQCRGGSGIMNPAGILGGVVSTSITPAIVSHFGWLPALASGATVAIGSTSVWHVLGRKKLLAVEG